MSQLVLGQVHTATDTLEPIEDLCTRDSPTELKRGRVKLPPFLRGARGDRGFRLQVRKSCYIDKSFLRIRIHRLPIDLTRSDHPISLSL
jgi:hypothetical protein